MHALSASKTKVGRAAKPASTTATLTQAFREMRIECVIYEKPFREEYSVAIKPGMNTACWAWKPPHHILVGDSIFENARDDLSLEERVAYAKAYLRHEFGHAYFTTRDLGKLTRELLTPRNISFSLFNLFEDARIEHRMRELSAEPFGWLTYEKSPLPDNGELVSAKAAFFCVIQAEGDVSRLKCSKEQLEQLNAVRRYWQLAIDTETDGGLVAVIEEFLKEFPEVRKEEEAKADLSNQLSISQLISEGKSEEAEQLLQLLLSDAQPISAEAGEAKDAGQVPDAVAAAVMDLFGVREKDLKPVHMATAGSRAFFNRLPLPFDEEAGVRVARCLRKLFVSKARRVRSEDPGRKLVTSTLLDDDPKYWQAKEFKPKRQKVVLMVDLSGSMSGKPLAAGKSLLWAFSLLARQGHIDGHLLLTGSSGRHLPHHEVFPLVCDPNFIGRIIACGGSEGIAEAMMAQAKLLREADRVFVYTDAQITDAPINRAYFASRGIRPVGLYVGQHSSEDVMLEHFPECLIRENIEALALGMLAHLKRSSH